MRPLRMGADDAPELQEVPCTACGTRVLVRKNSLTQTTIQWQGDTTSCHELAERRAAGEHTGRVAHCQALRTSIDEAVAAGTVRVVE
jgi:hypothetical protein